MIVHYTVDSQVDESQLLDVLEANFPSIAWTRTTLALEAEIHFVTQKQKRSGYILCEGDYAQVPSIINHAMKEGEFILPTEYGASEVLAQINRDFEQLEKLRTNNPLFVDDDRVAPKELWDGTFKASAHLLHPTALKNYMPELYRTLEGRAVRTLQRHVEGWAPVKPLVPDVEIVSLYPDYPKTATELRDRLRAIESELEALDLGISKSIMDYSQINLGLPFAGGHNRQQQGLTPPSNRYCQLAKFVAGVMLRGASRECARIGEEAFSLLNTRVGVKVNNYQGPILNTTSHNVRQTLWKVMLDNGEDIFYFASYPCITASGFRSQDNGVSVKKRASYIVIGPGHVARARVMDGDDLKGLEIAHYVKDTKNPKFVPDEGIPGARKRIVSNIWSGQNDALLPVPTYIGMFKDAHYKALYQQDEQILSRFVTGSPEFIRFWTEGYVNFEWVRAKAAERGFHDLQSFLNELCRLGEHVSAGDVVSFDGNASWEIAEPFFRHLMSEKALALLKKMWDSDWVGVYTDAKGVASFYYVTCEERPEMTSEERALVKETARLMSSLPSGAGPTAQGGRGPVPTALLELIETEFSKEAPDFFEYISQLPKDEHDTFSGLTALMNDGGDDHVLGMLVIWLITGVNPAKAKERVNEAFTKYTTLMIQPENPPMNCGFLFHSDSEGRCIGLSRSPGRLFANVIYPEYPRSATGLFHSVAAYTSAAAGSPIEDVTEKLANLLITKVHGFKSMEHLAEVASAEEAFASADASQASAQQLIAYELGIKESDLDYAYSYDDLVALGIDEDLLDLYRRPIPAELTKNPFNFLSRALIIENASDFQE